MNKWANPSGTKTYFAWRNMRARCYNPRDISYPNYGGRGIEVCPNWREDFDAFVSDMGECPEGLTLERKDGNQGYTPDNCCWATYEGQLNNRPGFNRIVEYEGRKQTLARWAKELGISLETLSDRLKKMPLEKAMVPGLLVYWAPGEHGRISTYNRLKCRCEPCRVAASEYKKREYRRRTGKPEYDL